jgi:hypothetical protein
METLGARQTFSLDLARGATRRRCAARVPSSAGATPWGKTIPIAAKFRGKDTLLVFWNPDCGFRQGMLADLKTWETRPPAGAPRPVLISAGAPETNRAMGCGHPSCWTTPAVLQAYSGRAGPPPGSSLMRVGPSRRSSSPGPRRCCNWRPGAPGPAYRPPNRRLVLSLKPHQRRMPSLRSRWCRECLTSRDRKVLARARFPFPRCRVSLRPIPIRVASGALPPRRGQFCAGAWRCVPTQAWFRSVVSATVIALSLVPFAPAAATPARARATRVSGAAGRWTINGGKLKATRRSPGTRTRGTNGRRPQGRVREVGWETNHGGWSVSPEVQARNLQTASARSARCHSLGGAFWFSVQDIPGAGAGDFPRACRSGRAKKPSFGAHGFYATY